MYANVLTIAGSDSGGGAGIQADLKAISATGAYGLSVITALTAQNTVGVDAIYPVAIDFLKQQMQTVSRDIRIDAVKVGMLATPEVTEAVAEFLETLSCPVVIDPVMVAKSGDRLLHEDAISALRDVLIPQATVITPNLPEAADLLDVTEAIDRDMMVSQARALLALGPQAVLLKGGHLLTEESPDLLMTEDQARWFDTARVATTNTHGTGCTLSSALASYLGQRHPVDVAVAKAKEYISGAIAGADQLNVGEGHGPVNHFWALWGNND
jgi:hydroxymethylpyrimidine/phosphomethylpyrimidine kinase